MSASIPQTIARPLVLAIVLAFPWLAHAQPGPAAGAATPTSNVSFHAVETYPESVAWSTAHSAFFVGSIHKGTIGKVRPDGHYTEFIRDAGIISSAGILYDAKRNLVWAAIGDVGASVRSSASTQGKLAAVAAYDATTGERRIYADLGGLVAGAHFANDLALDDAGNVYVTDSFSPVIYKVDAAGKASIFARSDMFLGENFNLNGIVYHSDGYLLVGKHNSGELFRISLDSPGDIQRVRLAQKIPGMDGLLLRAHDRLVVVQNYGPDQVLELVSQDGWHSATLQPARKTAGSFPTAIAAVGPDLYVLNSRLDTLLDKNAVKVSDYLLQKF
jgi:sugar lactone lactonase YvrE